MLSQKQEPRNRNTPTQLKFYKGKNKFKTVAFKVQKRTAQPWLTADLHGDRDGLVKAPSGSSLETKAATPQDTKPCADRVNPATLLRWGSAGDLCQLYKHGPHTWGRTSAHSDSSAAMGRSEVPGLNGRNRAVGLLTYQSVQLLNSSAIPKNERTGDNVQRAASRLITPKHTFSFGQLPAVRPWPNHLTSVSHCLYVGNR